MRPLLRSIKQLRRRRDQLEQKLMRIRRQFEQADAALAEIQALAAPERVTISGPEAADLLAPPSPDKRAED